MAIHVKSEPSCDMGKAYEGFSCKNNGRSLLFKFWEPFANPQNVEKITVHIQHINKIKASKKLRSTVTEIETIDAKPNTFIVTSFHGHLFEQIDINHSVHLLLQFNLLL